MKKGSFNTKKIIFLAVSILLFLLGIFLLFSSVNILGAVTGTNYNVGFSEWIGILLIISSIFLITIGNLDDIVEGDDNSSPEIAEYIESNTPSYLKRQHPTIPYKLYRTFGRALLGNVYGKDKLPEGPKLFIMPHRRDHGEAVNLMASLKEPVHIFYGAISQSSEPVKGFAKLMGFIPIKETLSGYTSGEKEQIKNNAHYILRGDFQKIIDREKEGNTANLRNIKSMVAMLLQGRSGGIFVEGPTAYFKGDKKIFGGYSLVAREYERVTGRKLPIIPVGFNERDIAFGEAYYLDENGKTPKQEVKDMAKQRIEELLRFLKRK